MILVFRSAKLFVWIRSSWGTGRPRRRPAWEEDAPRPVRLKVSAPEARGPVVKLDHLNPQTNHLSIPD
jgi:hypothetical protein